MRTLTRAAIVIALTSATGVAAQEPSAGQSARGEPREVSFEDADEIRGESARASGIPVTVRRALCGRALITPRTTFRPELLKSLESL